MRSELVDRVGGGERLTVDAVRALPYCCATFAEACRCCSLNPFLKRQLTGDVELDAGVRLRRGTVILFNAWAINNDPANWPRPDRFRPERFLTADGDFDERKMALVVPFGFGKRRCIGVEMGRGLCLLMAASIVRQFDITLDTERPDFDPVFGIGLAPRPHRLRFSPRAR